MLLVVVEVMFLSNPEQKIHNTIFMGPLAHRETSVDAFLNQKKDVKWSEEAENEYLESVKTRATEKVRGLLLQAKRRSDEIIHEAELHAQEITSQAARQAQEIEQKAQGVLGNAEQRYQDVYNEAVQKAQNDLNQILAQNQQALGESTAVVLLSIHEQLGKFYDVWKEDLKQLTLDAIEVGTGWVASTEKEAILKQLLDECVQKLIDKKNFIVRVNPADAELITQVLENSREKAWSMESSKELEPGSLELESDNVFIKNSHNERQKFVQEILDNLILPKNHDEELLEQQLKDSLNHEMQNNPVIRHSMEQNPEPITEIPLQSIMPEQANVQEEMPAPEEMPAQDEISMAENMADIAFEQAQSNTKQVIPQDLQAKEQAQLDLALEIQEEMPAPQAPEPVQAPKQQAAPAQADIDDLFDNPAPEPAPQPAAQPAAQPAPQQAAQTKPAQADIDNLFDNPAPQTAQKPAQADIDSLFDNPEPVKVIDELPDAPETHAETAHAEAADMVEEFLGKPEPKQEEEHALPQDLADDLLAEMGFNDK